MKNLISMTDFVLEQWEDVGEIYPFKEMCVRLYDYANFLKQPLELWMFVPCDQDGNVLKEPKSDYEPINFWNAGEIDEKHNELYGEYQHAKERCLFYGYDLKTYQINDFISLNFTVENMIKYNLILTQTALKQIGL